MKRLKRLILANIFFQIKYGFYFIYGVVSFFYIFILLILPEGIRKTLGFITIFSDPAAMGLFFMGAIILLEKSEKVLNAIAVSPVKISEYIIAKIVSIGLISVIVAILLSFFSGIKDLHAVIIGTFLSSSIFTLIGIIIGIKAQNLNQYIISTVPVEIISFTPPLISIFNINVPFIEYYPFYACFSIIINKNILLSIVIAFITIFILYAVSYKVVEKAFVEIGGAKCL